MSKRDELGILVQGDLSDPNYGDGGDSAFTTGISSFSGNKQDQELLKQFVTFNEHKLVRHPSQVPWNDPALTSRDQLVAYLSGCWAGDKYWAAVLNLTYDKNFINKDVLMPDVRNHMRLCMGKPGFLLGYIWLNMSILWAAKIQPDHELNQLLTMCVIAGPKYIKRLCKLHPDWKKNVNDYWCGWRDKSDIGDAFVARIEQELAK